MICFDVYLNGEKLCRAGKKELSVMSSHVTFVDTEFENDYPLDLSVSGMYEHLTKGRIHPSWIPRRKLADGDEVVFKIIESDEADDPVIEQISEPGEIEKQQRKYYEFLRAKYESENEGLQSVEYPVRVSQLLDVAAVWIDEAADMARGLNGDLRGDAMKHLAAALESILQVKAITNDSPAFEGGAATASEESEPPEPDGLMSPEQRSRVDQLADDEIKAIDHVLLANASHRFRKVAYVVGMTMRTSVHKQGIPDVFYVERIRHLVTEGKLESEGDLNYMRFSEVRPWPSGEAQLHRRRMEDGQADGKAELFRSAATTKLANRCQHLCQVVLT